jgi:hypothetical protein
MTGLRWIKAHSESLQSGSNGQVLLEVWLSYSSVYDLIWRPTSSHEIYTKLFYNYFSFSEMIHDPFVVLGEQYTSWCSSWSTSSLSKHYLVVCSDVNGRVTILRHPAREGSRWTDNKEDVSSAEVCSVAEGCFCLFWCWWRPWLPPTQLNLRSLCSIGFAPTSAPRGWVAPPVGTCVMMTWCSNCGPAWSSTLSHFPTRNMSMGPAAPFVHCCATTTSATRSAAATSAGEKRCQVYVVSAAIGCGPRSWYGQGFLFLHWDVFGDTPSPTRHPPKATYPVIFTQRSMPGNASDLCLYREPKLRKRGTVAPVLHMFSWSYA